MKRASIGACMKCGIVALLLLAGAPARAALPSFSEARARFESSDGRLFDRYGHLLQRQRLSWDGRTLDWVPLSEMSPALKTAVLEAEDRRFAQHHGIDWQALAGAAWQNFSRGSHRGASTISMQTAALLTERGPRRGHRGLMEKIQQLALARELESRWTKEQILETYLNLVSFRGEQRGIAAASRSLFGRAPDGLDLRESTLLATLLRAPGMSAAAAGDRLCRETERRKELGSCESLRTFAQESLNRPAAPLEEMQLAPQLARRLLSRKERDLKSTLRLDLQLFAQQAVRDQLENLKPQNVHDAAVIVADNSTGEVLVYVGGSGAFSSSPEVDMAQSPRQAGSTLKPFLYALAFDKQYLSPDSWLLDEPFELGLERGAYAPDNYDHLFHGPVHAREALASSLNIPAVRVVELVGVDSFREVLDQLGFRSLEDGDHYGPSLALGTADITLFDLVQAYMALANSGRWQPLHLRPGERSAPAKRILSARAAGEVAAILSNRGDRALTFGWDSLLATPYPTAVKTGTSKDMRDNWCVGFSRRFTVGVWVGNGSGEPMWAVSGVEGAAPVWRALMDRLHDGRSTLPLPTLAENLPKAQLERGRFGRILYPASGALLALDPDIPPSHQKVMIEAQGGERLILDGALLADSLWQPARGRHHLRLTDASGAVLDELSFEVR
jgi:penicillin-binding protein 1C